MVELPSAEHVALAAVSVLAAIVAWDAYWLTKQRRDVPELGSLKGGGFAWASEGVHEMVRQWGNLGSMAAMMVLPWALLEAARRADEPRHSLGCLPWSPSHLAAGSKRYAIVTHLFADGQRYPSGRLRLAEQPSADVGETDRAVRPAPAAADPAPSAREYISAMEQAAKTPSPVKQNERHPHGPCQQGPWSGRKR